MALPLIPICRPCVTKLALDENSSRKVVVKIQFLLANMCILTTFPIAAKPQNLNEFQ